MVESLAPHNIWHLLKRALNGEVLAAKQSPNGSEGGKT